MLRLGEDLKIGSQMLVGATNVLCTLRRTIALTNIAPIVRGHAIVMPVSGVGRTAMLDDDEWLDLWRTALLAQQSAELSVGADASNLLLREGAHAAWADAPAHLHVVPRLLGDFARNEAIFDAMQTWLPPGTEATMIKSIAEEIIASGDQSGTGSLTRDEMRAMASKLRDMFAAK